MQPLKYLNLYYWSVCKKLLFSENVVIGQSSYKWPGLSIRTVSSLNLKRTLVLVQELRKELFIDFRGKKAMSIIYFILN